MAAVMRFNPRAREGRDIKKGDFAYHSSVSIHAPARGATQTSRFWMLAQEFQSTRPRGARRPSLSSVIGVFKFQSTRPRGARPSITANALFKGVFQSTRPRGARPRPAHRL